MKAFWAELVLQAPVALLACTDAPQAVAEHTAALQSGGIVQAHLAVDDGLGHGQHDRVAHCAHVGCHILAQLRQELVEHLHLASSDGADHQTPAPSGAADHKRSGAAKARPPR